MKIVLADQFLLHEFIRSSPKKVIFDELTEYDIASLFEDKNNIIINLIENRQKELFLSIRLKQDLSLLAKKTNFDNDEYIIICDFEASWDFSYNQAMKSPISWWKVTYV